VASKVVNVQLTHRKACLLGGPEVWKVIPSFPRYKASSFGRVKGKKVILSQVMCGKYLAVHVYDGEKKIKRVHILVAEAFHGPCPPGKEVNHKDTDKLNNRSGNLEYLTRKKNMEHAVKNGLTAKGERHGNSKLTEADVKEIKRKFGPWFIPRKKLPVPIQQELRSMARNRGVAIDSIHAILRGQLWKHV
jgi:hypothetical protein